MLEIPESIHKTLLPNPHLNVIDITSFSTPPHNTSLNLLMLPAELFSDMATWITELDNVLFLQSLEMPAIWDIPNLQECALRIGT